MYYTKETVLFQDGKYEKAEQAHTDLFSQSLHYGFGAFEGIRAYETANGVKLFKAEEHFDRLHRGCEKAGLKLPYTTEELIGIAYHLIEQNELTDAYVRPLVYAGPGMYLMPARDTHFMMCVWKWGKYHGDKLLKLGVSSVQRPNPASTIVDAKISGQYVSGILASREAQSRGYDEALMLDMNGNVAASPVANFFIEKNNTLYTPPLGHIFPSITRQVVMSICREMDLRVVEKQISPHELESADSAFLCGTAVEIAGISSIDAHQFTKPWKECIGAVIQEAYKCQVRERSFNYVII